MEADDVLGICRTELAQAAPWRALGPAVTMLFPLANTPVEVRHGLGQVPDGYMVIIADAAIKRVPGKVWDVTLAYVQADMANATATLVFGLLRQGASSVTAI